ncbi:MAG: hypothetical protein NTW79_04235 [Candidatus Berkelbacteria bacterium]|nr:hypothetical protein [Candidatus Berkelbacteria bacterium]
MSARKKVTIAIAAVAVVLVGGYGLAKYGAGGGSVSADTLAQPNMPRMQMMAIRIDLTGATSWASKIYVDLYTRSGGDAWGQLPDDSGSVKKPIGVNDPVSITWSAESLNWSGSYIYITVPSKDYTTSDVFYNNIITKADAYYDVRVLSNNSICKGDNEIVPVGKAGSVAEVQLTITCDFSSMMKNVMKGVGNVFTPPPTMMMNPIPPTTTAPVFSGPTVPVTTPKK